MSVVDLNTSESKDLQRLEQIMTYISLHYHEKITLSDISQTVYITPQHLCRFFKNMTTMRLMTYINHYRLQQARYLLVNTRLNITDIALMCGFDNISYFNRVFKNYFHCTPSSLRTPSIPFNKKAEIR